MTSINSKSILQSITIGIIAGMRSALAPALASYIASNQKNNERKDVTLKFLRSKKATAVLTIMAAGELIVDKLPATGNRIEPAGITARFVSGGASAALLSKGNNKVIIVSALIGSVAAIASAYGCYYLRKNLGKNTSIPDFVLGAIEDSLAIGAGIALINNA